MSTKERILSLLEADRGESISGEHIAKQLDISRNSVWKAVNELKKDGHKIEAITNKGYRLCSDSDVISLSGILPHLSDKACADNIHIHSQLKSTNLTAKEMALSGAEHGTVVIADSQTAGRGRYGREFYSPHSSGIYMSIILKPHKLDCEPITLVTALAALIVCMSVESVIDKSPGIKWVNDIYLDNKKISGILTEAVTDFESGNIEWVVVGIGLNFSAPSDGFPTELSSIAGTLFAGQDATITRNRLIAEIINEFTDAGSYNKKSITENYRKRLMMLNKKITVISAAEKHTAMARDIDSDGRLIVEKDSGEVITLSSGEISISL